MHTVVFVEGVSDRIAVETLAGRHGRDLAAEGVLVQPTGGAHGMRRHLREFAGKRVAGLCDAGEVHVVQRALDEDDSVELAGLFVCVEDLEDELIRAAGTARVQEVFGRHGDLAAFHTIQRQPAWRSKDEAAQLRRFLSAGSQRKIRYARLLVEAIDLDRMPGPLAALLDSI
jgi:hypothetical protein